MTNVQKLKKLRVYRKFVRNLKAGPVKGGLRESNNVDRYIDSKDIGRLMWSSFIWDNTPEGRDFWAGITPKLIAL